MENLIFEWEVGCFNEQECTNHIKYINNRIIQSLSIKMRNSKKMMIGYISRSIFKGIVNQLHIDKMKIRRRNKNKANELTVIKFNSSPDFLSEPNLMIDSINRIGNRGIEIHEHINISISNIEFCYYEELETLEIRIHVKKNKNSTIHRFN